MTPHFLCEELDFFLKTFCGQRSKQIPICLFPLRKLSSKSPGGFLLLFPLDTGQTCVLPAMNGGERTLHQSQAEGNIFHSRAVDEAASIVELNVRRSRSRSAYFLFVSWPRRLTQEEKHNQQEEKHNQRAETSKSDEPEAGLLVLLSFWVCSTTSRLFGWLPFLPIPLLHANSGFSAAPALPVKGNDWLKQSRCQKCVVPETLTNNRTDFDTRYASTKNTSWASQ